MRKKKVRKKIGKTWSRRNRKINGKNRYVYVRKIDGKYQTRVKRPEIHGSAKANRIVKQKGKKRMKRDRARSNKVETGYTDKELIQWRKKSGASDLRPKDTKGGN